MEPYTFFFVVGAVSHRTIIMSAFRFTLCFLPFPLWQQTILYSFAMYIVFTPHVYCIQVPMILYSSVHDIVFIRP